MSRWVICTVSILLLMNAASLNAEASTEFEETVSIRVEHDDSPVTGANVRVWNPLTAEGVNLTTDAGGESVLSREDLDFIMNSREVVYITTTYTIGERNYWYQECQIRSTFPNALLISGSQNSAYIGTAWFNNTGASLDAWGAEANLSDGAGKNATSIVSFNASHNQDFVLKILYDRSVTYVPECNTTMDIMASIQLDIEGVRSGTSPTFSDSATVQYHETIEGPVCGEEGIVPDPADPTLELTIAKPSFLGIGVQIIEVYLRIDLDVYSADLTVEEYHAIELNRFDEEPWTTPQVATKTVQLVWQ